MDPALSYTVFMRIHVKKDEEVFAMDMCINRKANGRHRGVLFGTVLQCWMLGLTDVLNMETWSLRKQLERSL